MELSGKIAVVTGAAGALGGHLAGRLAESGCRVAALDRDRDGLDALRARLTDVSPFECDLTDPNAVDRAVEAIQAELGDISILVNTAGAIRSAPLVNVLKKEMRRHSGDLWREVLDVNLSSAFLVSAAVADIMLKRRTRGVIVNVSSISAAGNAGQSAYSAAKAGIEALTAVWARELSGFGIRCAAVAPGFIETESTAKALGDAMVDRWKKQIPLGRLGTPDEFVDAVLFIIGNDYFNGKVLAIDGGLTL